MMQVDWKSAKQPQNDKLRHEFDQWSKLKHNLAVFDYFWLDHPR